MIATDHVDPLHSPASSEEDLLPADPDPDELSDSSGDLSPHRHKRYIRPTTISLTIIKPPIAPLCWPPMTYLRPRGFHPRLMRYNLRPPATIGRKT
jgi:hypothetical protein